MANLKDLECVNCSHDVLEKGNIPVLVGYKDEVYVFCSMRCTKEFLRDKFTAD
jgi:endogenous inhibitor of DNA gyrase (YacG/DUF329 family)